MDVLVSVANQKLRIATNLKRYVAGTQKFVRFIFDLSNEWKDLTIFAQFRQGDNAYNQYLDKNNAIYLPTEITEGVCTLMLYGTGDSVVATTNCLTLYVDENMLLENADSTEISTSLYEQMVAQVQTFHTAPKLIERIEITDPDISVISRKVNLKHVEIYITTPVATTQHSIGIEPYIGSTMCGYGWLGNAYNTSYSTSSWFRASIEFGCVVCEHTAPATGMNTTAMYRSSQRKPADGAISRLSIYGNSSNLLESGTVIEIWGIEADA